MQTQILWYCGAETPLSFLSMCSAVGTFLLARSRKQTWMVLPDAGMTPVEAARLRRELHWIGADPDGSYASESSSARRGGNAAAAHLITSGKAYCDGAYKRRRVFFRLPETPVLRNVIVSAGAKELRLQPNMKVEVSRQGIFWRGSDGVGRRCSFAAMQDLVLLGSGEKGLHAEQELFSVEKRRRQLQYDQRIPIAGADLARFTGRNVRLGNTDGAWRGFPMEELDDPVIVDDAGRPSPLLRRVLATIETGASTVAGVGLDEREAALLTLLFDAFGYPPPRFLLLPPATIENAPDYAACRRLGLLPEVLFHELARLACGRSPETEIFPADIWIRRFNQREREISYCRSDRKGLFGLNRQFLSKMPPEEFVRRAAPYALKTIARDPRFADLAKSKQKMTAVLSKAAEWRF